MERKSKQISACGRWIETELQPNFYGVVTLKQGRQGLGEKGTILAKGTRSIYEAEYGKFLRRLAKDIYGKTVWRRFKDELVFPNIATIEGNGYGGIASDWHSPRSAIFVNHPDIHCRAHINIMMRLPEEISFFRFQFQFKERWKKMGWAMPDAFAEKRTGNCIYYSLKEGLDSLLLENAKF